MFATLLGGLPRPPIGVATGEAPKHSDEAAIEAAIRAQEAAGLEPVTDGRIRTPDLLDLALGFAAVAGSAGTELSATRVPTWTRPLTVATWRSAATLTGSLVKQALPGPYTLGRRLDAGRIGRGIVTMALAEALRAEVDALAEAGCPLVEIEETEAHLIGEDENERRLFRDAHRRLADGVTGTHLSLSIIGGSADSAGAATILDPPYASLAVDLIAGPDNWRLVVAAPPERGIVAGAMSNVAGSDDGPELLVWAVYYAASTAGRGMIRIGLGTAGGLAGLHWSTAEEKLNRLGEAARVAALGPGEALARALDPRAVSARSAALGRYTPKPKPKPKPKPRAKRASGRP